MTENVGEDLLSNDPRFLAVYQALVSRYSSTTSIVWTVPALGLSAQAFLISAGAQAGIGAITGVLLAMTVLLIGIVTITFSQKFEHSSWIDRQMLDRFEQRLLGDDDVSFRLQHGTDPMYREQALGVRADPDWRSRLERARLVKAASRRLVWVLLQLGVTLVGAAVPLLSAF